MVMPMVIQPLVELLVPARMTAYLPPVARRRPVPELEEQKLGKDDKRGDDDVHDDHTPSDIITHEASI